MMNCREDMCLESHTTPTPGRTIKSIFPQPARSRPVVQRLMLLNAHLISQTPTTRHLLRQTREKVTRTRMALASLAR